MLYRVHLTRADSLDQNVVGDLRQICGFLQVSSTNKTDSDDITEILLKVVLNTITITLKI
jgi:hypothetical protein